MLLHVSMVGAYFSKGLKRAMAIVSLRCCRAMEARSFAVCRRGRSLAMNGLAASNRANVATPDSPHAQEGWEAHSRHAMIHLADEDNSMDAINQLQAELWQAECGLHKI